MAHTSLYRTYRPQTFDDVVGQSHIERTIRNAVADGSVAHAYLFCGPRGTGKTTTARLLAKALLCENGPTSEPDATCEQCVDVAEGRHPDVYELDAASRTGVDNVREEIIGRVQFAPTRGRYKLYIIDEVHMLSTAAFNALLKTLEEPPPNVVFVLCTTHPHKVPETIQSRCQRFDFHRISLEDIASRLRTICDGEGYTVPDAALTLIARHASGGMRDAITTLEQLASFTGGNITLDDVEGLIGEVDSAQLFEVCGLVAHRDIAGCFRWVAGFVESGTDLSEFVRTLTGHVRDLYLVAAVGDATGIVDRGADELSQLQAQAAEFGGPDRLARVLDLLGELGSEMRWSSDPRLSLEVALTRMARPRGEMTLEALAERVEAIELGAALGAPAIAPAPAPKPAPTPEAVAPAPAPAPEPEPELAQKPESEPVAPVMAGATLDRAAAKRGWSAVLAEIKKAKPARVQALSNVEVDVDPDGTTLVIEFPSDQSFSMQMAEEADMRELVRRSLAIVFGTPPAFRYQLGRGAVRPAAPAPAPSPTPVPEPEPKAPPQDPYAGADSAAGLAEPATAEHHTPAPATDDIEHMLLHELGVQIVEEHAHGAQTAEPEQEYDVQYVEETLIDPEGEDDQ